MWNRWVSVVFVSLAGCGGGAGSGTSATAPPGCASTATVVCTQSGQLQGAVEGNFRAFRGIPFAAPPVGDLRWRAPAAPVSWQGVRTATAFGNRCPQIDINGVLTGNEDWYAGLESVVGCNSAPDVLACLRAVPADALVQTSLNSVSTGWVNIEPNVLPEDPFIKLKRLGSPVPLLIGSTSDELAFTYVLGTALDPSAYATAIHAQFDALAPGAGDTILALYPAADFTNPNYALDAVETDADFTCSTRDFALAVSGAQRPPVWRYLFSHTYENDATLIAVRAFHTAELPFVSGNLETGALVNPYVPSSAETALANQMMDYWARFATTGNPNGPGSMQWLPYDAGENILRLDDSIVTLAGGYRNAQCNFLSTLPIQF